MHGAFAEAAYRVLKLLSETTRAPLDPARSFFSTVGGMFRHAFSLYTSNVRHTGCYHGQNVFEKRFSERFLRACVVHCLFLLA
jgi:hypothetical protein